MWFAVITLASIVSSLVVGHLLAKAVAEQTNPRLIRGPSLQSEFQADRLAIAARASRLHYQTEAVHLN